MKFIIGKQGVQGIQGRAGKQGIRGVTGIQGIRGTSGNRYYFKGVINVLLVFMLVSLGIVIFWMAYPYKPIVFNGLLKVENNVVKQGETLKYTADFCKYTKVIPITAKSFVNDLIYVLPLNQAVAKPVGCSVSTFVLAIPKELPPAKYKLRVTYTYHVNPVRDVNATVDSETFTVIK